jgi:hypothetical protein
MKWGDAWSPTQHHHPESPSSKLTAKSYRIAAGHRLQGRRITAAAGRKRIVLFLICHRWSVRRGGERLTYPRSIVDDFVCHADYTTQDTEKDTSQYINLFEPRIYQILNSFPASQKTVCISKTKINRLMLGYNHYYKNNMKLINAYIRRVAGRSPCAVQNRCSNSEDTQRSNSREIRANYIKIKTTQGS